MKGMFLLILLCGCYITLGSCSRSGGAVQKDAGEQVAADDKTYVPIAVPMVSVKLPEKQTQEETVLPRQGDFLIPGYSEDPRYPRDFAIGPLGRGQGDEGSFKMGNELLTALRAGTMNSPLLAALEPEKRSDLMMTLSRINPRITRLSGGELTSDGGMSFLFRFIGADRSAAGELYLLPVDDGWKVDDIIMEEPSEDLLEDGLHRYDPLNYTRFF